MIELYSVNADGSVVLTKAKDLSSDPAIEGFLNFLENDIKNNPHQLKAIDKKLINHIKSLLGNMKINIDEALSD